MRFAVYGQDAPCRRRARGPDGRQLNVLDADENRNAAENEYFSLRLR